MPDKRILIADADAKAWDDLRQILGESWAVTGAANREAALAEAKREPFDVVLAHFDLPDAGGAELLNRIRVASPKTIRFIMATEALKENVMSHVLGGHQFLLIPFDPATLKSAVERSMGAHYGMSNTMRDLVSRIRTFPTIPSLYVEVVNALKNPNATTSDVGVIIAKDMAMTTKLVQVLNSAYYGLSRTITDPTEAVGMLGFETVKSLVMSIKLLNQYDKLKPVYFSIDNIWRHSTNVARAARTLALLETGDADCGANSFTAGLMHDLGKVILAASFDGEYQGVYTFARKQQTPLWKVEKDIFGASHGEIGAYLLGLWGMAPEIVEASAFHHCPSQASSKTFAPLTAVHVANALEYEGMTDNEGLPVSVMDTAYLRELGLAERVDLWRQARRDPGMTKFAAKSQRAKSAAAAPAAAPRPQRLPGKKPPREPFTFYPGLLRWLGIGLGISAAMALLARLEIVRLEHSVESPRGKEIAQSQPPVAKPEKALAAPPAKVAEEARPVAVPTNAAAPVPPTNAPALIATQRPPSVPQKWAFDHIKVGAIFYSAQNPSALINGTLARVDQEVADCRVLTITPTSVTLEHQRERKTFTLR